MLIPSTRHALRTRKYMSTMYILVTFHQSLDRLYRKVADGTVFDRHDQAVEPPSWYIMSPPFTRWVKTAVKRAEELGAISPGKQVSTHTLRHSYARHLLMNGIPINYLSRWLGHSSIQTTLIYLELVPDPTGSLAMVP